MDLKKLNRMPLVLAIAMIMVLVVAISAWAAPSEQGEEKGKGNDKKEAQAQPAAQPTPTPTPTDDGDPCTTTHGSDTGNGANTDGPDNEYTSRCDGRASDNGNDSGGGGGRPCAGCVGNADDKNPPGQAPNDTDSNKGYECDGNNGVGGKKSNAAPAGNPAHTGCRIPPTDVCTVNCGPPPACPPGSTMAECVPKTCPNGSAMPSNGKCNPPGELCPDGSVMPPSGKCDKPPKLCPDGTPMSPDGTCVRGIIIEKDKNPGVPDIVKNIRVQGAPEEPQVAAGGILPFTGGDLMPLLTLAMVLIAVGVLSLRRPATNIEPARFVAEESEPTFGATVQLPSGKSFKLPLRRTL